MKRVMTMCALALMILFGTSFDTRAQELSPQLKKIAESLEPAMKEQLPEWEFERVPALLGSPTVLIEFWSLHQRKVKVSILLHSSELEASETIRKFVAAEHTKLNISGIGDEAYTWGYENAVAFRKRNLTVYVSANSQIPAEATSNQSDQSKLERDEESALSKNFARIVSNALFESLVRRDLY